VITAFHAKYFARALTRRCPSDSVQKLADAQVDLNPHQIDAALFAFRSPLSKGAILADEVRLGKNHRSRYPALPTLGRAEAEAAGHRAGHPHRTVHGSLENRPKPERTTAASNRYATTAKSNPTFPGLCFFCVLLVKCPSAMTK